MTSDFWKDHPEFFMFVVMVWASGLWLYANHTHNNSAVQLTWGLVAGAFGSITTLVVTNRPKGPTNNQP